MERDVDTGAIRISRVAFLTNILFDNGISHLRCLTEDAPLDSDPDSLITSLTAQRTKDPHIEHEKSENHVLKYLVYQNVL